MGCCQTKTHDDSRAGAGEIVVATSYPRYESGKCTRSIWMGHLARRDLSDEKLLQLDHGHFSGCLTKPFLTGFKCMYSSRSLNSFACLTKRSQN